MIGQFLPFTPGLPIQAHLSQALHTAIRPQSGTRTFPDTHGLRSLRRDLEAKAV